MASQRTSGILLHPTSLPGPHGIGDIGERAYAFVDFLVAAGQRLWQVLPLGPTGFGDSPYQSFSAFAGNPLLISLETLVDDGLLSNADLAGAPQAQPDSVDYGAVIEYKLPLIERAWRAFEAHATATQRAAFSAFCQQSAHWLDDFSLFMTMKKRHRGAPWTAWPREIASRHEKTLARLHSEAALGRDAIRFAQYQFNRQWARLRQYASDAGVRLMGDVPIFVAHDSADVWAHADLFQLNAKGAPEFVAGVPPDYFSATGQLWGNPLYRWEAISRAGFRFWIDRLRRAFEQVDLVRVDHFRGFESYWEVPGQATTAANGRWAKGPGAALFDALVAALGELPIVAENLGVITEDVEALRRRFGFPGMAVLQFAFGGGADASAFLPHNHTRDLVVYTGTHDNDTTVGWWAAKGAGDSTRTTRQAALERDRASKYLGTDGHEIHWAFIRAALGSVADTAVVPLQDVLGLGSVARMNRPGRPDGNWRWRYSEDTLTDDVSRRLRDLTAVYGRIPPR